MGGFFALCWICVNLFAFKCDMMGEMHFNPNGKGERYGRL